MNLFELQERLKDFSQDQLVREMQAPTGMAPQYLVLSELQRRQRMMAESQAQMPQDQTTVAQDAVAAAGVPQAGLAAMAQAMAPRTDMDMNTGVQPVERMADGGAMLPPRLEDQAEPMSREELASSRRDRLLQDAVEEALAMMESSPAGAGRSAISRILQQVAPEGYAAASDAPGRGLGEDEGMGVLAMLPALLARRRGVDLTKAPMAKRMQEGGLMGDPLEPYAQYLDQTYSNPTIESFVENVKNMEQQTFGNPGMAPAMRGPMQTPMPQLGGMRAFGVMPSPDTVTNMQQLQLAQQNAQFARKNAAATPAQPMRALQPLSGSGFSLGKYNPLTQAVLGGQSVGGIGVPRMADGGVVRMQPGGLAGISRDLGAYSPTMGGARAVPRRMMEEEDARRRRAELAATMFQYGSGRMPAPTGEGQLFDFDTSPLLPQEIAPEAGAPPVGADLRGLGTVIKEFVSGEDPEETANRLLESGQIDEEQYNRYVFGSDRERETIAREALDLAPKREFPDQVDTLPEPPTEDVFELPELVIDSEQGLSFGDQFPPVDVRRLGDEALGFGAIAPTSAPVPLALPLGMEEEEAPVTPSSGGAGAAAPAMDDAFEQDKWLALAQFGLNLMASQQPTFGGALGEAGLAGITALRTAREERDARATAAQARADRLAAAASRGERDTYPYRQVDDIISMADSYAQAAASIVEDNFGTPPVEGDPNYEQYINSLAMANVLRRRALALTGLE